MLKKEDRSFEQALNSMFAYIDKRESKIEDCDEYPLTPSVKK